jgi:tRNA-dihydrouridine synthase C
MIKSSDDPFIMLAPMEGVVDAVTRKLYSEIGGFDRFVTEFVRVSDLVIPKKVLLKYYPELNENGLTKQNVPVFLQLLGGKPEIIAQNALQAATMGAPGIDLNFGCPAPTVNRNDGGATLLKNPHRLFDVVSAVRKIIPSHVPVTAKVRLGFSHKDSILEITRAVCEGGAAMLTVHARTRDEGYKPPAHWEFIGRMREVSSIPVVANGEIWTVADYMDCKRISGCADVALGRGAIATPDLALQIRASLSLIAHNRWEWRQIQKNLLPKFIESSLQNTKGDGYVTARTKQWMKQLQRGFPESTNLFNQIKSQHSTQDLLSLLAKETV